MEALWFWLFAGMLATYIVLDGFDLGVGVLHLFIAKNEAEKSQILRSIGPVWDGNEVWLIAAGGTMIFAFPKLYAISISGFYLPVIVILWLLVFRALGIELRHQLKDPIWKKFWDVAFALSSILIVIFYGAALGGIIRGVPLSPDGTFFEPLWTDFTIGPPTGIIDWYTLLVSVNLLVALAYHGALWLNARTDGAVQKRADGVAGILAPFVFLLTVITALTSFGIQPILKENLIARPWGVVLPIIAIASFILSFVLRNQRMERKAFYASMVYLYGMAGTVGVGLFPFILPAIDPKLGLTAQGVAAAKTGLVHGLYWWIPGILLALIYLFFYYGKMPEKFSADDPFDH